MRTQIIGGLLAVAVIAAINLVANADTIYYGRDNYNSGGYSHYFKSRDVSPGYPVNTAFVRGLDWYPV
ncbi:MAG: hypothetical protein ACYS5V_06670, partial [Planctomycetota bacterium]